MSLTGRIEKLYFIAKLFAIAPLVSWVYFHAKSDILSQFTVLLLVYGLINMLIMWLSGKRLIKGSGIYFPLTAIDVLYVFSSMAYFGEATQNMYVLFYFLILLLSIIRPASAVILAAAVFTVTYISTSLISPETVTVGEIVIRCLYIWLTGGMGFFIARFIGSSEKKLLKTLDVLNERTWELESSQSMLENMYETTRMFSTILDIYELMDSVLNVAKELLQVKKCTIMMIDQRDKNLCIYAELDYNKKHIYKPPKSVSEKMPNDIGSLIAAKYSERLIIGEDKSKRVMEVPLISHGKVLGLIQIEPPANQEYAEKERKNFTILANATAIAMDNAVLHMKMQELTVIDELTGLFNYRYFRSKLSDEVRRAERYHQTMSILMIDVDHFKEINDTQGHQTGNIILQEIVSLIKRSVRDVDVVARYGGEEFVVLLPQTQIKHAMTIAERMRRNVEKSYFTNFQGQREIRATISIGVAVYPDGVDTTDQLLDKVDQAMYRAKRDGRNRVVDAGAIIARVKASE